MFLLPTNQPTNSLNSQHTEGTSELYWSNFYTCIWCEIYCCILFAS